MTVEEEIAEIEKKLLDETENPKEERKEEQTEEEKESELDLTIKESDEIMSKEFHEGVVYDDI